MFVEWQLIDRAGGTPPEGRRSDIEVGQLPPRFVLETDMEFGLDGYLVSLDKRITDHGNVTTFGSPLGRQGLSIKKSQTVGARDCPEFTQIGGPYFSVRLIQISYIVDEVSRLGDCHKW